MAAMLTSVTAIILIRDHSVATESMLLLSDTLARHFNDVEIVLVVIEPSASVDMDFKVVAETVPDVSIVFLNETVRDDVARLLGIDHAISDYILFCTPLDFEIGALSDFADAAARGVDLVLGHSDGGVIVDRGLTANFLFWLFCQLYSALNGANFEKRPPSFRMLSRPAAMFIATRNDGEIRIRANSLGSGFTSKTIDVLGTSKIMRGGIDVRRGISTALQFIMTGSTLPLRFASYLGFFSGIGSLFYAVYVLIIYLFKAEVAPGWTTLSLQSAGMMFAISLQFLLLSEYLIKILATSPVTSRRYLVAREVRGSLSRRSQRLNIVDQDGRYQIGAPADLLSEEHC
jgi:polyisoprenyl-phosphate glycosyltransferase